jgi:hypothetical protein
MKALGLNRAETMFRSGQYVSSPTFPAHPGYGAVRTVAAIGEGVRGLKKGSWYPHEKIGRKKIIDYFLALDLVRRHNPP